MFNDEQDRDVSKADVRQWRVVDGVWKQVPIGEVLIPERRFQFINGETEASVFPGKCRHRPYICTLFYVIAFCVV